MLNNLDIAKYLLITLAASCLLLAADAANKSSTGFHLLQESEKSGKFETFLEGDYCRFDNKLTLISVIINGQNKTVTVVNHKKRQFWLATLTDWTPTMSYVNNVMSFTDFHEMTRSGTETDHSFSLPTRVELLTNPAKFAGEGRTKSERLTAVTANVTSCPALTANKSIIFAATKLYCIAPSLAYPLCFTYKNRKGGVHHPLRTTILERAKVPGDKFTRPPDYTLASSQRDIYLDTAGRDTLEDMLK